MEIYLSVGVSTLVALMAAHRADAGGNDQMTHESFAYKEPTPIEADLDPDNPQTLEPGHSLW